MLYVKMLEKIAKEKKIKLMKNLFIFELNFIKI